MQRIRNAMKAKEQGFTLIELLVVIIIIGILAAIAIPVFLNQRKKAVDAGLKADLKNTATSIESLMTDNPMWGTSQATGTYWAPVNGVTGRIGAGQGQNWDESVEADARLSPGNVAVVHAEGGAYCIKAWNPNASTAKDQTTALAYDSTGGGLQASGYAAGACTG